MAFHSNANKLNVSARSKPAFIEGIHITYTSIAQQPRKFTKSGRNGCADTQTNSNGQGTSGMFK